MAMITAHSGSDHTPDNSMEFVCYALASAADCIEVDVRQDQNGSLILSHDEAGDDCVPLSEVFTLLRTHPDKKINCDLKLPGMEQAVYQLACAHQVEKQLIYSGEITMPFSGARLYVNLENLWPDVYRQNQSPDWTRQLQAIFQQAAQAGVSCINVEEILIDNRLLSLAARMHMTLSAWTVNDPDRITFLLSRPEVENITTRSLQKALELRDGLK